MSATTATPAAQVLREQLRRVVETAGPFLDPVDRDDAIRRLQPFAEEIERAAALLDVADTTGRRHTEPLPTEANTSRHAQREAARKKANRIRLGNAALVRDIRAAGTPNRFTSAASGRDQAVAIVVDVLHHATGDAAHCAVEALLGAIPFFGPHHRTTALRAAGITQHDAQVRDLTHSRRVALAAHLIDWCATTSSPASDSTTDLDDAQEAHPHG